jgi:hypothetical protein
VVGKYFKSQINDPPTGVDVEGIQDRHLGPRWEFAKIRFRAEPAEDFLVEMGDLEPDALRKSYLDAAILGVLDIILVSASAPLKNVKLTVTAIESHEIDSSPNAFRMAGREAGKKLIDEAMSQMLSKC